MTAVLSFLRFIGWSFLGGGRRITLCYIRLSYHVAFLRWPLVPAASIAKDRCKFCSYNNWGKCQNYACWQAGRLTPHLLPASLLAIEIAHHLGFRGSFTHRQTLEALNQLGERHPVARKFADVVAQLFGLFAGLPISEQGGSEAFLPEEAEI